MFKDTPNGQTNYYISKCCHAQVYFIPPSAFSNGYICQKCHCDSDIIPASELKP